MQNSSGSTSLYFIVGKQSDGTTYLTDLRSEGHLFISWSREEQIDVLFQYWLLQLSKNNAIAEFAISVTKKRAVSLQLSSFITIEQFIRYEDDQSLQKQTIDGFIRNLEQHYQNRKKQQERKSQTTLPSIPMLILIDDLFQLLHYRKKQTGLKLLKMLSTSQLYAMHFIVGSPVSYRNLMAQIQLTAAKESALNIQQVRPGAELVITDDLLHFYRSYNETDFTRLFPPV